MRVTLLALRLGAALLAAAFSFAGGACATDLQQLFNPYTGSKLRSK